MIIDNWSMIISNVSFCSVGYILRYLNYFNGFHETHILFESKIVDRKKFGYSYNFQSKLTQ